MKTRTLDGRKDVVEKKKKKEWTTMAISRHAILCDNILINPTMNV